VSRSSLVVAFLVVLALPGIVRGHEVRPGYLEIGQTGEETFDVHFKVPARGDLRLSLYARLPERCEARIPVRTQARPGAFIDQWSVTCAGGLVGETIRIEGLSATLTDVLVRLQRADGTVQIARLTPDNPTFVVEGIPSTWNVAGTYLALGVEHILLGIDHLLFVLALLLLVKGTRRIIVTVTAFTLAHSLTLAGATLGFVQMPGPPIEATIALSIMFVAAEIMRSRQGNPGLTEKYPWVVAFTFGLLHGFGFAGALTEIGLPAQAVPLALLFFNVGVEVGQLLFIACMIAVFELARQITRRIAALRPVGPWASWARAVPPYAIGSLAVFWLIQRIAAF